MDNTATRIGFLIFPGMLQLDFIGAYGVLASGPQPETHRIWKDAVPVRSSDGLGFEAGTTFQECPRLDVLVVPGGAGADSLIGDDTVLDFLRHQAETASWIASVCTGALVLGAAGLLRGRRATTHWLSLDLLRLFGAEPVSQRVVIDGNRITAAGVTSGIDMALTLAGRLWGDAVAQEIQLVMEYDPRPPYRAGSPDSAPAAVVQAVRGRKCAVQAERGRVALAAAERLNRQP